MTPFEPPGPDETFGAYIQRARRFRALTQRDLATALGIDFTYLSKIENRRGEMPGDDLIRGMAQELGLDAELLLALAGKVPPELKQIAQEERDFAIFLRSLPSMTPEERREIYQRPRRD